MTTTNTPEPVAWAIKGKQDTLIAFCAASAKPFAGSNGYNIPLYGPDILAALQAEREWAQRLALQYDAELRHSEKVRKELAAMKEALVLVVKTLSESGYPSKAQWAEIQKTAAHLLKD